MREIYIVGDISYENYEIFAKELAEAEAFAMRSKHKSIKILLTSPGGDAFASLAYAARIRTSPCEIYIHASGYVASAAVLVLACGDKRTITAESWVMIHEEFSKISGSVSDKEVEIAQERRMEEQCYSLLETRTGVSSHAWQKYHEKTTYFSAEEALNLRLVDEVV